MKLRALTVHRLPGISSPFTLEGEALGGGVTLILGPNGSGKSSVRRALTGLLWPSLVRQSRFDVEARWEIGGGEALAVRHGSAPTNWQREGQPSPAPELPDARLAGCYAVGVLDLLRQGDTKDPTQTDSVLAEHLRRQLAGGYDLEAVRDEIFARPPSPHKLSRDYAKTQADLREARTGQQQLAGEEDRLPELTSCLEQARQADEQAARLDRQLQWVELRQELDRLLAQQREHPPFMQAFAARADVCGQLEKLDTEEQQALSAWHAAQAELERLEAEAEQAVLPADKLPSQSLRDRWRAEVDGLRQAEQARDQAVQRRAEALARLADARAGLEAAGLDPADEPPELSADLTQRCEAFATRAQELAVRRATWREGWRRLDGGERAADAEDAATQIERLRQASSSLEDWLALGAPAAHAPLGAGWAGALLLAAAAIWMGLRGEVPVASVLGAAALLLVGLLLRGQRGDLRVLARDCVRRFADTGLPAPRSWNHEQVRSCLKDLQLQQRRVEGQARLEQECIDYRSRDELLGAEERELSAARQELAAGLGLAPPESAVELLELSRRLAAWSDERRKCDGCEAALLEAGHEVHRRLEDLGAAWRPLRRPDDRSGHWVSAEQVCARRGDGEHDAVPDRDGVGVGASRGGKERQGPGESEQDDEQGARFQPAHGAAAVALLADLNRRCEIMERVQRDRPGLLGRREDAARRVDQNRAERLELLAALGLQHMLPERSSSEVNDEAKAGGASEPRWDEPRVMPGDLRLALERGRQHLDAWHRLAKELSRVRINLEQLADSWVAQGLPDEGVPLDALRAELQRERERLKGLMKRRDDLSGEIGRIKQQVQAAESGATVQALLARRAELEDRLRGLRDEALRRAAGRWLLDKVSAEHEREQLPEALARASDLFGRFTAQRYELRPDRESKGAPRAVESETGHGLSLSELSDGTRAQLLLAVRLGFVLSHEQGEAPPLILDEFLAGADPDRFMEVAASVLELARDGQRQALVFTADPTDVPLWRRAAEQRGLDPPGEIDLGRLRRLAAWSSDPAEYALPELAVLLDPSGLTPEEYARALSVPRLDAWQPVGCVDLFHLLRGDLPAVHDLRQLGMSTVGPWRLARERGLAPGLDEERAAGLDRAVRILEALFEHWRGGRSRPIERSVLEELNEAAEKPLLSDRFLDEVGCLLQSDRVRGDPAALLAILDDPHDPDRPARFQVRKAQALRKALEERGDLGHGAALERDALRMAVLADLGEMNLVQQEQALRLTDWLLESLTFGSASASPA